MKLEDEINKAIAIVQEAARDGRIQVKYSDNPWQRSELFGAELSYRAKPDPIDGWFIYDILEQELCEQPYSSEEEARRRADRLDYPCRVVYLREVE